MSSKFPADQSVKHTFEDSSYPLSVNYVHLWVLVKSGKQILAYLAVEQPEDVVWDLIKIVKINDFIYIGNNQTTYSFEKSTYEEFEFVCKLNSIHFLPVFNLDFDKPEKCGNCGQKVKKISTGEICPACFC